MLEEKENARGQGGRMVSLEPNIQEAHSHDTAANRPRPTPSFDAMRPYHGARLELIPLHRHDERDSRGRERGKVPADPRWTTRVYDHATVMERAQRDGLNLGVRLPPEVVVLDVDPRNYPKGRDSLKEFVADTNIDLSLAPHVITGSDGHHYYFQKPKGIALIDSLEKYQGLEFKSLGRQVVAAGSVHPNGKPYRWAPDSPTLADMPDLPPSILKMAQKRERPVSSADGGGEITGEQLTRSLAILDPCDYSDHYAWLHVMMASHHATAGEGRQEFIDWSTQDPEYADHGWIIGRRWDSLDGKRDGAITIATLRKLLQEAGGDIAPCDPEDDFDEWIEEHNAQLQEQVRRWRFLSIDEVESLPPPKWLIPGMLTEYSLAAIYGAPESGKSFLAVDMALAVSSGISWHGRNVISGGVLYIAAEGAPGLGKRFRAWKIDRGARDSTFQFDLMPDAINFAAVKEGDALAFVETVKGKLGPLKLIIIDTLNQTAAGADENSAMDMGRYVASMKQLRDVTGAAVVVVHHSGKDLSKGMRGSTALLGAMDTTIAVERSTDRRAITVSVQKQKDAEREPPMRFNLEKVADSLVLRATLMADAAEDFGDKPNAIVELACQLAKEHGGSIALKELVAAIRERDGIADKTARRRIDDAILVGKDQAVTAADGTLVWLERIDNNSRGAMKVRIEASA